VSVAAPGYRPLGLLEPVLEIPSTVRVSALRDRLTTRKEKWLDSNGSPVLVAGSSLFRKQISRLMYGSISVSKVKDDHANYEEDN
jgi:hypothetical protein